MKESEFKACLEAGVDSVTEVQIGFDGIAFANAKSGPSVSVTKPQLFLALAAEVPVNGEIVANPHQKWSEIDASLPDTAIQVFGPPPDLWYPRCLGRTGHGRGLRAIP